MPGNLGPYRLDAELGAGAMGTVYRATVVGRAPRLEIGAVVALKVVHPHLLDTPGFFKRFLREAEIGTRVRHENVVATFDADAAAEGGRVRHFLAMELVEGQTLRALAAELGRVPEELCRHVGREAAKGLAAIHAAGVVHRDVKPENLLVTREHVVKVMDLGLARTAEQAMQLSQSGVFVGSVMYAAPEQFGGAGPRSAEGAKGGGDDIDGRADLHALGLVLYELATGVHPYRADDFHSVLANVLTRVPRRCAEINPQLSPFFDELVATLLEKDRAKRFASAAELADVLAEGERSPWWRARAKAARAAPRGAALRARVARETAVHGRDAELALLRSLFQRASDGDGQVVLVDGEAGVGKSRLVDEFVEVTRRAGGDFALLFGAHPPGGAATAAGAFTAAFSAHFGEDESGVRAALRQTPLLVPAFAALLRGDAAPAGAEPLSKDALRTVFVHAVRGLAEERTTIVWIDDLQCAPPEGLALFAAVATAVAGRRALLVGTARPGLDAKWVADLARTGLRRLPVPRLSADAVERLLAEALGSEPLAGSLAPRIAAKTDGNPYFVFEILRALREERVLEKRDDGSWATTRSIDDVAIPSTVRDLVAARVADLEGDARDLLEAASCVGAEFDPGVLGEALGRPPIPLLRALGRIEQEHRLVRSAGHLFAFDHVQVRDALYAGVSEPLRREYHAVIGDAMERRETAAGRAAGADGPRVAEICGHLLRGTAPARALPYLDAALSRLSAVNATPAALELAELALAAPRLLEGAARLRVARIRAGLLDVMGRRDEERAALDEALLLADAVGDDSAKAGVRRAMGWHFTKTSQFDAGREWLSKSIEIARACGDRSAEEQAIRLLGITFSQMGRFEESRAHYERARAIAREIGDVGGEAASTINLGIDLFSRGRFEEARVEGERGLALARQAGNRRWEANATTSLLSASMALGLFDEAVAMCERGLRLARETGFRQAEATALGNYGEVRAALGDAVRARRDVEVALTLSRELRDRTSEGVHVCRFGIIHEQTGDLAAAERRYREATALLEPLGDRRGLASATLRLGSLLRRAGRIDEARPLLERAALLAAETDAPDYAALAAIELASPPGGDVAAARAAFALHQARLEPLVRLAALHGLWRATGDAALLAEARRVLDHLVAHAPAEFRKSMVADVPLHREVAEASA